MKKLPTKQISTIEIDRYVETFFKISLIILISGFAIFAFTYFLPRTEIVKAEEVEWIPHSGKSMIEVHIANDGLVFLQGARVESVSKQTIIVSTSWKATELLWTINTNGSDYGGRHFGTDYFDSKGNRIKMKDIRVGEIVLISGIFDVNQIVPTIKANVIRTSR